MYNFNMERFGLAAMATAFADVCWKEAYDWATEREAFGMPLIGHQVRLHAGRQLRLVSEVLHRAHQECSPHSGLSGRYFTAYLRPFVLRYLVVFVHARTSSYHRLCDTSWLT